MRLYWGKNIVLRFCKQTFVLILFLPMLKRILGIYTVYRWRMINANVVCGKWLGLHGYRQQTEWKRPFGWHWIYEYYSCIEPMVLNLNFNFSDLPDFQERTCMYFVFFEVMIKTEWKKSLKFLFMWMKQGFLYFFFSCKFCDFLDLLLRR